MTITFEINERFQQQIWTATIHDAETEAVDGEWFDVRGFDLMSIDISGVSGETIVICASNDEVKPADNTHGRQLGTDVTADGVFANVVPLAWMKLRISAGGAGAVTARFMGVTRTS